MHSEQLVEQLEKEIQYEIRSFCHKCFTFSKFYDEGYEGYISKESIQAIWNDTLSKVEAIEKTVEHLRFKYEIVKK